MPLVEPHITPNKSTDLSDISKHSRFEPSEELSMDDALLKKLRQVVELNLKNEQFTVENLADEVALSRSHLHRKLHKLTGESISQFIRKIRLEHAIALLRNEVGTVSEIAFRVGFGSSTYFIKCFSDEFGFSPGEVKKKNEEGYFNKVESTDEIGETSKFKSRPTKPTPLETLHPASSEALIREIFDALILHKPSLEKFMSVEEEEGEQVDMRLLAYQIFKNYPWPIGVEIRRLFSVSMKDANDSRFQQLNKTIFTIVKLLSFIVINEYLSLIQKGKLSTQKDENIRSALGGTSASNLILLIEKISKKIATQKNECFVVELANELDASFFREIHDWNTIVNDEKSQSSPEESCAWLEQILIVLLKKSAFLVKYKLVNVGDIKVLKSKFSKATFEHQIHILNNSDSEFQIHQEILEAFSDSNAVLLIKSVKEPTQFLNLSPLLIDTHHEENTTKEKSRIRKDIFLFDRFEDGKLFYHGTETTASVDSSQFPKHDELIAEYDEMIKTMIK